MSYFPFMIDIGGKSCLVAGGGNIACHKVKLLSGFGVHMKVVGTEICHELSGFPEVEIVQREFRESDIEGMDFVVAATDDERLNDHISDLCRKRKIPVNAVDRKEACSFIFPAIIKEKDMLIAVSTGGQSPAAAAYIKNRIKSEIPEYYGDMVEALGSHRDYILKHVNTAKKRKEIFHQLLEYGDSHKGEIGAEMVKQMIAEKTIRIGTRGSLLALEQTRLVIAALRKKYPQLHIETVILHTRGDKVLDKPLYESGGKGMFVTEFEEALAEGRIDLAVHSAKDLPTELAGGLFIAGALQRADVRDVLVTGKDVPKNMVIGTGSLRRQLQLREIYPEVQCISIRGNVPTRLQKVRDGECDGVVLAAAGLERLGLLEEPDFNYRFFSREEMVPAGGQGIIAIEGRTGDETAGLVSSISDQNAMLELETERRILQLLEAGCHEAIGVISRAEGGQIAVQIIRESGGRIYRRQGEAAIGKRLELAQQLADSLQKG
ncbi:MAG: hydroxymethylbilane synthase [Kineothrix sp.]